MGDFTFKSNNYSNSMLDGGMSTYGPNTPLSYPGANTNNGSLGSFSMGNGYSTQPLNLEASPFSTMSNYGGNPGNFNSSALGNGNAEYGGAGLVDQFKAAGGGPKPVGSIWSNVLKQPDGSGGWGSMALGVAEGAANYYFADQGLNAYKENTKNAKREFDMNYGASRQEYNTSLKDRQDARVASDPGSYQDTESYMKENQIV